MRTKNLITSLRTALVAAPLLAAACGGNTGTGGIVLPPGGLTLPDCTDGQLIAVGADRTLSCASAPTAKLSPPACQDGVQALTYENDTLKCVNKGSGTTDVTLKGRIDKLTTDTADLTTKINDLKVGGGAKSVYVGNSNNAVNGAISSNGLTGLAAAADICGTKFGAGAHMCTVFEIYDSVASGKINSTTTYASKAWVYMVGWNSPAGANTGTDPKAGLNDNCGGYTYPTGDRQWYGTAFTFDKVATMQFAPRFYGGSEAACSASFPIACCK